ncbi:hypothetical protein D3C85_1829940 [compost metagenome]
MQKGSPVRTYDRELSPISRAKTQRVVGDVKMRALLFQPLDNGGRRGDSSMEGGDTGDTGDNPCLACL